MLKRFHGLGGSGNNKKHVLISARELARFGHLLLNRGQWRGKQLLSQSWVDAATSVQVPETMPLGGPLDHGIRGAKFPIDGHGVYGYLAARHVDSLYFLTMNVGGDGKGDGKDVWPWVGTPQPNGDLANDNLHYDISKLQQWESV